MKPTPALNQPPELRQHQAAPVRPGQVVMLCGRLVVVESVHGGDAAAPVIVEELTAVGRALVGQFGLWPLAVVAEAAGGVR